MTMPASAQATQAMQQQKAEEVMRLPEPKLLEIVRNVDATEFARAKACQRLAVVGTRDAVPVLASLLSDPKMSHYARFGLEPIPDPAVDQALREALGKTAGRLQTGVIHSIGQRRDAGSVEALAGYLDDFDLDVARAAALALGRIGTPEAAQALQQTVVFTGRVAGACLECCDRLLAAGNKQRALELYEALLSRSDLPEAVRQAAEKGRRSAQGT